MKSVLPIASLILGSVLPAIAASAGQQTVVVNPALRAFIEQVDREWLGESHQQAITLESLQLLMNAIETLMARDAPAPGIKTDLATLRNETQRWADGKPDSAAQSEHLSRIFVKAAALLSRLGEESDAPEDALKPRLAAIRRSAEALDPKRPPRSQPDVIERYFHQAAEILRQIKSH